MGLSFGGSTGGTSSSSSSNSSGTNQSIFSPGQSSLQSMLGQFFQSLIPSLSSGSPSTITQAATTQTADQINKNFAAEGNTLQQQLAARGFGPSGLSGQTTLQTELAREGAQAGNLEAGANSQIQQNQSSLLDALNYAFTSLGSTASAAGTTKGSSSGWGVGAGVGVGIPGMTPA